MHAAQGLHSGPLRLDGCQAQFKAPESEGAGEMDAVRRAEMVQLAASHQPAAPRMQTPAASAIPVSHWQPDLAMAR